MAKKKKKYVIIRTYSAEVHAGYLEKQEFGYVKLTKSRRLWRWHANKGISLNDVSVHGIDSKKSRICSRVKEIELYGVIEIIQTTKKSQKTIEESKDSEKDDE